MRKLLFNVLLRIWRPNVERYYHQIKSTETLDAMQLKHGLLQKLNRQLSHFYHVYPFYRKLVDEKTGIYQPLNSIDELARFPIVTKEIIRSNFNEIACQKVYKKRDSTSGSTGNNFSFYHSRESQNAKSAAVKYVHDLIGIDSHNDKKVILWGNSPLGGIATVIQNFQRLMMNAKIYNGYGLNDERCGLYLRQLKTERPALLTGYPSMVAQLANYGIENSIQYPDVENIVLSGEQTTDDQLEIIKNYFRGNVFIRYGSREFGAIAHQCKEMNGLHVVPERFVVESGSDGEILITDLDNTVTPFIRYRINDAGEVAWKKCACGRMTQMITGLQGRANDAVYTKSGRKLPSQFWTVISRSHGVKGIREFQVIQETIDAVTMNIVAGEDYDERCNEIIQREIQRTVGDELVLTINVVESVDRTRAGKRRFIISKIGNRA